MGLVAAKCTQCGANIQVDDTKEAGICEFCGTAFIIERAINNYNVINNYNIQNAIINVQNANVDNLKKLGDEKMLSASYPFEMDNYVKAQEYFSKVLEHEDNTEYRLKYDLCDKINHVDRTPANEIVNIIDRVIQFIKIDRMQNNNIENRTLVYVSLINTMTDVVEAICMYYYERFSAGLLDYSVFISMHINIVKKKLECADLMIGYPNILEVEDVIICLCKTCEGDLATCISNYTVGNNNYSLSSDTRLEVKNLAEQIQLVAEIIRSSYQVRNDILTCDSRSSNNSNNGCYIATCVYGSYDCPQVWTLRRFRDYTLNETWYGRLFIKCYYAISPALVKWFGKKKWFKGFWKSRLDKMVANLNNKGINNTYYNDKY